jgi:hypothetical protein
MLIAYNLKFFHIIRIWLEKKQKLQIIFVTAKIQPNYLDRFRKGLIQTLGFAKIETKIMHIKDFKDDEGTAIQFGLIEKSRKLSLRSAEKTINEIKLQNLLDKRIVSDFHIILAQQLFYEILDVLRKSELAARVFKDSEATLLLPVSKRYLRIVNSEISIPVIYLNKSIIKTSYLFDFFGVILGLALMFCKKFISVGPSGNSKINTISTLRSGYESERIDIRNNISWFIRLEDPKLKLFTLANLKQKNFFGFRSPIFQNNSSVLRINKPYLSKTKIFKCSPRATFSFLISFLRLDSKKYAMSDKIGLLSLIIRFIWELESNFHLIKKFKCRVFIYEDDHFVSHVINGLAKLDQIDTIKLQYSNMGMKSLFMLSNPNKMLLFSKNFKSYFSDNEFNLGPKKYIESGYSVNNYSNLLLSRSAELRNGLGVYGASYVIGVFDESVQNDDDLWAWKTKSEYLSDVEALCNYVISNKDVGVIFKTQFVRNNPSIMFPDNGLIAEALSTKRIVFPWLGNHRNLILPSEIALASDICIGDIVGGTASLEAALCGSKSIMIDSMNFGVKNRRIYYDQRGIVFKDFNSGLEAISENRKNFGVKNGLGDWSTLFLKLGIPNENMQEKINEEIKLSLNKWIISK